MPGASAAGDSPADEAALAQEARDVAGGRFARERRAIIAQSASPAPDTEADTADPGWRERTRLNLANSYYRGTLWGAGHLAYLAHVASTPDEPGISPAAKRMRDVLRAEYRQAVADLARYDRMHSSSSAGEFGAAALGQLGGAVLSPESWLGLGAKGATWLWRAARAGLQQGAITGAADPVVQGLNIKAGVQDQYDPWRTLRGAGAGFVTGATARSLAEAISRIGAHSTPASSPDGGSSFGVGDAVASSSAARAERLARNRATGLAFEQERQRIAEQQGMQDLSPQLTLRTPSGIRTRPDLTGRHPQTNEVILEEHKGSDTAPLTNRQKAGFPEIEKSGALVVGKGKPGFPGGTVIPPTRVKIIRRPRSSEDDN
jgi:hypothetical protein